MSAPSAWFGRLAAAALLGAAAPALAQASAQAEMLVQSSPLAGFRYYQGAGLWEQMKVGDALELAREPANPHDPNAVRVLWRGQMLPPVNVLVVDDEALIRWSLSEILSKAGYHVIEAQERKGTLRVFEQRRPGVCVVLLDIRLPDSRDLSLLRTIREVAPDCRVIVLTAHGTPELT